MTRRNIVFCHHKCASQWIRGLVNKIHPGKYVSVSSDKQSCGYGRDLGAYLKKNNPSVIGVANACYQNLGDMPPFRGFHVIRDPRDIVVSAYYSHRDRPGRPKESAFLKSVSLEKGLLSIIRDRAWQFQNMRNWNYKDDRILEFRFEDLIEDPQGYFTTAFAFFGYHDINRVRRIVNENSFERLTGRKRGDEKQGASLRKGVSGEWASYFTNACKDLFKELYGDMVVELGYDQTDDW